VEGPLNLPRGPQGRPVLVQAGSSSDGKNFAAKHAEVVFTAQQTLTDGVVPILRERGLFRDGYEGATLRENLGLPPLHTTW
jgi:alkanesulfonate monooxygenase SsuD/methylene tetrahydromethanopterin reductase-like flavin-dependent oxidoreductase (luciferase family)